MTRPGRIGLLGGTFDPFHAGHLAVAHAARTALALDSVHVIPADVPPHRPQPLASGEHRFAMAALGICGEPGLVVDDRELRRDGPSFTSRTLAQFLAEGWTASQLFFIAGADAFAEIATWRDYPALLDAAHFVVIARGSLRAAAMRAALPALAPRMHDIADGATVTPSAPTIFLLDVPTPAVSATSVRQAAAAGQPLGTLVPALVAQHIVRHQLYRGPSPPLSPTAGSSQAASELHEQKSV
jgi:nicotinate-nucleotide adenylyltransferase